MFDISEPLVTLLSDLISIKSESGNEKEICDQLETTLESVITNIDGELIRVKNTLLLNLDFGKDKRVALVGHIDTVPVADCSIIPVEKDGVLWGRGACDMKHGVASMLKIIYEITEGRLNPENNLSFIFYENEEGAIPNGINFLLDDDRLKNIDFAYILEPTECKYSIGCLGSLAAQKEFHGISAHSANARKGKSALIEANTVFSKIEEYNSKINGDQELDGLSYYETMNVTTFKTDNSAFNVIPAKATMIINYRFGPDKDVDSAFNILKNICGEENLTLLDNADSCYIGSDGDNFLLNGIEKEIMQAWTDIAQLNAAGIPAINYGAGSIKYAHKADERINLKELDEYYLKLKEHL